MQSYWFKNWGAKWWTFVQTRARVVNWLTVVGMRVHRDWRGLRLLHFRNGLNLVCRGGTQDWEVISELAINGGYELALAHLRQQSGQPLVLDLGGNIGVFSLLAAQIAPNATIHSYEPAPANLRMFELNCLANESLSSRIQLIPEAVGGTTRTAEFLYDEGNPQASRIEAGGAIRFPVQIRAFAEVMAAIGRPVALVKMDIECAEYEVLEKTPDQAWNNVIALSLELHPNPKATFTVDEFLQRLRTLGFKSIRHERIGFECYFLSRTSGEA